MNILFVCTGNTCRSPMAQGLFNKLAVGLDAQASSAGIMAQEGQAISRNSYLALKDLDIDLGQHRTQSLSQELLDQSDLIITMSENHKHIIEDRFLTRDNIFTLSDYAYGQARDIADPYGRNYQAYEETRNQIGGAIEKMIEKIKAMQAGKVIGIGSDHGGFELKEELKGLLDQLEISYIDYGTKGPESVDYPEYGKKVARAVASKEVDLGIVICGTGIGISLAANKVEGIRCALCSDSYSARMSRNHNNANMLALGARVLGVDLAKEITKAWLSEEFEGGRHERRVNMIEN